MTWRDDDICYGPFKPWEDKDVVLHPDYLWERFLMTDELFKKYKVNHTVAIICKYFEKNKRMLNYMTENPHIIPAIHCWEHKSVNRITKNDAWESINFCIMKMSNLFGADYLHTVFPVYNETTEHLSEVCSSKGLDLSNSKIGLSAYCNGHKSEVVNFHYWDLEIDNYLEEALIKYTKK